jgi:acid phosphatase family membrane protein YuiD
MQLLQQLFANTIIWAAITAWAVAQSSKAVLYAVLNREFKWERLFGDGGMPSGHSATVAAAATVSGLLYGLDSYQFAFSGLFALVVMHDARGVRREAGKQARLLQNLVEALKYPGDSEQLAEGIKQFVGHTPLQVATGAVIGVLTGLVFVRV